MIHLKAQETSKRKNLLTEEYTTLETGKARFSFNIWKQKTRMELNVET